MSKKSYAKIITDLIILSPDAIKENIKIFLEREVKESVIEDILFRVLDKMSQDNIVKILFEDLLKFFTETELEAIVKYMQYFQLNLKAKITPFYSKLLECIQEEIQKTDLK